MGQLVIEHPLTSVLGEQVNCSGTGCKTIHRCADYDVAVFYLNRRTKQPPGLGIKCSDGCFVIPPTCSNSSEQEYRSTRLHLSWCTNCHQVVFDGNSSSEHVIHGRCDAKELHLFDPLCSRPTEDICRTSVCSKKIVLRSSDDGEVGGRIDRIPEPLSEGKAETHEFRQSWITFVGNPVEIAIFADQECNVTLIRNEVPIAVIAGTQIDITLVEYTVLIAISARIALRNRIRRCTSPADQEQGE